MSNPVSADPERPGVHWISFANTNPPSIPGFYWLLSISRDRLLAHWDGIGGWRSMTAGGESFKLQDTYTHFTPVREPKI